MNSYELSRRFFDWSFENPEKVSPTHIAMYFFIIEHCNRLGWKEKFGLPTTMVKDAIGIKNFRTYTNALNDLVEWGFIKMIEKSKNQYSSNIIAIVQYTKASTISTTKALDKALQSHSTKQSKSIDSIDKPNNNTEPNNKELNIPFDLFWNLYDKKEDRKSVEPKWLKLTDEERLKAMQHIPKYKIEQPDKKFRKNPETYLSKKSFNNEIIGFPTSQLSLPIEKVDEPEWWQKKYGTRFKTQEEVNDAHNRGEIDLFKD